MTVTVGSFAFVDILMMNNGTDLGIMRAPDY